MKKITFKFFLLFVFQNLSFGQITANNDDYTVPVYAGGSSIGNVLANDFMNLTTLTPATSSNWICKYQLFQQFL